MEAVLAIAVIVILIMVTKALLKPKKSDDVDLRDVTVIGNDFVCYTCRNQISPKTPPGSQCPHCGTTLGKARIPITTCTRCNKKYIIAEAGVDHCPNCRAPWKPSYTEKDLRPR